ncbi:MAG: hypothetical protein INR70_37235 [Parafilimonas terrae]|nr:hypothetical protein [Parafilimonas terrae]
MSDLTLPLIVAAAFVGVGWVIVHAGRQYDDAIHHTLTIFALAMGLLVLIGVTAKLRARLGIGRSMHRIEARSQVERPGPRCCDAQHDLPGSPAAADRPVGSTRPPSGSSTAPSFRGGRD